MTRRLILSACILSLAGAAHAQPAGPPPPKAPAMTAEHRAQMSRDLHVLLRLRPDQEAAWKAFEAATAPPDEAFVPFAPPSIQTTPQRLDEMAARRREMDARVTRMEAATRSFYAALSPEQQQAFDAIERLRGPRVMPLPPQGPGGPPPAL